MVSPDWCKVDKIFTARGEEATKIYWYCPGFTKLREEAGVEWHRFIPLLRFGVDGSTEQDQASLVPSESGQITPWGRGNGQGYEVEPAAPVAEPVARGGIDQVQVSLPAAEDKKAVKPRKKRVDRPSLRSGRRKKPGSTAQKISKTAARSTRHQPKQAALWDKARKVARSQNAAQELGELPRNLNSAPAHDETDPEPLDLASLLREGLPPPAWIIPNWLEESDIVTVAGYAGCGKTTAIYDLALALVQGRPWAGSLDVPRKRRVMIIDEEMGKGTVLKYLERLGADPDKIDDLKVFSGQGLEACSEAGLERMKRLIKRHQAELLIIDSSQHVMGYENENDSAVITTCFKRFFSLREMGITIIIIHHLRKPNPGEKPHLHSIRGSSAFTTQSSNVWVARKNTDGTAMELSQEKTRSGGPLQQVLIRMDTLPDETIKLTSEPVAKIQMTTDRTRDFVVNLLGQTHEPTKTADIIEAAKKVDLPVRNVERALKKLSEEGIIKKPRKGYYVLPKPKEDPR